jgi:glycosyltransferase involved in cell wall biosynthesis
VGGLGTSEREASYWDSLQELASAEQVHLWPNAGFEQVRRVYEEGSIFWHAAGYGEDPEANPGGLEHFGIATVEAMAAGCVPVVINQGGQPELVQHGVNGFVWDTLDELKDYTRQLIHDGSLRQRMAQAAREHARSFRRERFVQRFRELVGPALA